MNKAIETLMIEHRLIEQVLAALATFGEQLENGQLVPRERLTQFAAFFREYADKFHHGKEEERLFVCMNQFGFSRTNGPIGVMLAEHETGRRQMRTLGEIGRRAGELRPEEGRQVVELVRTFIPLLSDHIQKEDYIFYPMAVRGIPGEELDRLDRSCKTYDEETIGSAAIQTLKNLAQDLLRQFPPHPKALVSRDGCSDCECQ